MGLYEIPQLIGRYVVIRPPDPGQMGRVPLHMDTRRAREVSLKVDRFDRSENQAINRFCRQARHTTTI